MHGHTDDVWFCPNNLLKGKTLKRNIPLSWSHKKIDSPNFHSVNLPLSGLPWIYTADVPANYRIEELINQLETQ